MSIPSSLALIFTSYLANCRQRPYLDFANPEYHNHTWAWFLVTACLFHVTWYSHTPTRRMSWTDGGMESILLARPLPTCLRRTLQLSLEKKRKCHLWASLFGAHRSWVSSSRKGPGTDLSILFYMCWLEFLDHSGSWRQRLQVSKLPVQISVHTLAACTDILKDKMWIICSSLSHDSN